MIQFTHVFVPSLCRFQLSTPSLQGLFALCALGLLQGDSTLTQATLQELSGLVKSGDKLTDVATLTAALKVQQVGSSGRIFSVCLKFSIFIDYIINFPYLSAVSVPALVAVGVCVKFKTVMPSCINI